MEKSEVLKRLAGIGPARRGQLSEQWYVSAGSDGKKRKTGPYYVWQRSVGGKKVSVRIPKEDAARVREEIGRGGEVGGLLDAYWACAEGEAESLKKKRRNAAGGGGGQGKRTGKGLRPDPR